MLKSLHIKNYVLIDSLEVDFPEGLVIITGQTGAGKSIILGALSLLMGAKADASAISAGAESCVVEGEFISQDLSLKALLDENDIEWNDGSLIIRRTVASSGRSRSFINDSPVPVGVLAEASSLLVDIHSQHQSLALTDHKFQLNMLDSCAHDSELLQACAEAWNALQKVKSELQDARATLVALKAESDFNKAMFSQLDEAHLREGELEELEIEQKQLANAEEIKEQLSSVEALLDNQEVAPVASLLKEASHILGKTARFVPSSAELSSRLDSARIEISDILSDVADINSRIDVSPSRLEAVEDRMSLLYDLFKKHSCTTESELIAVREKYATSLADSSSLEEKCAELESLEVACSSAYDKSAAALSAARHNTAKGFAEAIQNSLRELELDKAQFCVNLTSSAPGPKGTDQIQFLFSSNGTAPVDVSKCASGGEISRIMLCLKAMMARHSNMPTMIFDEIDTGVSGSTADRMGSMICRMGETMQVFAITHLPQVAAKGCAHYIVSKAEECGRVVSTITKAEGDVRLREIARLLSGATITEEALANARTLIS